MEAKHTPGPWELRNEFGMQGLVYPRGVGFPVAATTGYFNRAGQTESNARLIAAAPELLEKGEALANLVERYFRGGDDGIPPATESEVAEAMYALRAAIARATA